MHQLNLITETELLQIYGFETSLLRLRDDFRLIIHSVAQRARKEHSLWALISAGYVQFLKYIFPEQTHHINILNVIARFRPFTVLGINGAGYLRRNIYEIAYFVELRVLHRHHISIATTKI
ncbi:hypothetical protein DW2_02634 [Thioclava atlantica]|uniref:Uncharacterized protein n=1 Tax=Thioclava atlantica TaxID=1317124 RepID=A0A085TZM4_9RHOB|nr:hypothetical protein DW2_02634 [Thioclava atlantica]